MVPKNRGLLPGNVGDFSGLIIVQLGLPAILFFELYEVLPTLYADSPEYVRNLSVFVLCLFFNTELSFWMTVLKTCSLKAFSPELPSKLKPGWVYCQFCQLNAPPRSSHCFSCGACILRRDHHCVFTGNCIGFHNHRHFLTFLLNFWIGAAYAVVLNTVYLHQAGRLWSYKDVISMFLPIPAYLFGFTEHFHFFSGIMCTLSVVSLLLSTAMAYFQLLHILYGQTAYERKHRITDFAVDWKGTLREIAGTRWYVALLSPLIPSPRHGDGLNLKKASEVRAENIKTV
ncbi:probable palmitoyltransferase ZDHHC24 [Sycon ciliatum]|uniref:probable palmitoyltransferase ZDHHC24 n=1 Tax=Sycon ciliatum TaxID=27933 RepID=UPI0031F6B62D|eukprot:scpid89775/ scgid35545/ Probable palmitoyltransferase ZDHHC24; Membrane-associated zinc finger protein DHHC25; Zinc finger DHHC domain-containing protein 24